MTIDEMGGKKNFIEAMFFFKINQIYFEEAVDNFLK
jgi:hypothetical protein